MLDKGALVLEGVTLGSVVQLVVEVLVDLAACAVLDQQPTENTLTAHPDDLPIMHGQPIQSLRMPLSCFHDVYVSSILYHPSSFRRILADSDCKYFPRLNCMYGSNVLRHTGIGGTLALSEATVTTDSAGEVQLSGTGTGVHGDGLSDDEAIGDQLADGLAGVGVGDLVDLVGVEPDLALTAAEDIGREALLSKQVDPREREIDMSVFHSAIENLDRDEFAMATMAVVIGDDDDGHGGGRVSGRR